MSKSYPLSSSLFANFSINSSLSSIPLIMIFSLSEVSFGFTFFGGLARVAWLWHRLRKPRRGRKSGKLDDPRRSNRSLQRSWQRRRQPARRVKQPDDHIGSKYATSWLTAVWNEQLSGKFKWRTKPYRTDLRIGCSKLADFHSFKMNTESILNPTW